MPGESVIPKRNLSSNTDRIMSASIWADCPREQIRAGRVNGVYFFDDFVDLPLPPTLTTQIAFGKYKGYAASGCTITRVSAVNSAEVPGGCASITLDTDDDEVAFGHAFPSYLLTNSRTNSGKLWFECCYAQNSVATNMAAGFFGLAEVELYTYASNTPFNSGDAIANTGSFIGFRIEEDGLGVVDTVYSDRATSFTNIGDTEGGTLVANTFKKFGFVYDLDETDANRIVFYADGLPLTTRLTGTALSALTNLDANSLGLVWMHAADSAGTSFASYMKWWACAQIFPGN